MKIYVDQQAISRNARAEIEEPVFIIEHEDGSLQTAHAVVTAGPALLCYDRTKQPRAWLETSHIVEG